LVIYIGGISKHFSFGMNNNEISQPKIITNCCNCGDKIRVEGIHYGYYLIPKNPKSVCYYCWKLEDLTKNINFLALTQKAIDKGIDGAFETASSWLKQVLEN